MKSDNRKTKLIECISVAVFTSFTIGIYAPISIYCANVSEYWYTLGMIWYVPLVTAIIMTLLLFVVAYLSRGVIHDILIGLEFGLGICLYLQGNFLNMKVGSFDGSFIDWGQYRDRMILNVVIWVLILAVCAVLFALKPLICAKAGKYLSVILTAMQLVSLIFLLVPVIREQGMRVSTIPTFTDEGLYEVGDDNIIVLIVDVLDEQYIDYSMREIPDCNEVFDGFEFYDNFTSEYQSTNLSFPCSLILGKQYHNEKSESQWIEENAQNRLYFDELSDNGYETTIYTEEIYSFPARIQNLAANYRDIKKRFYNTRTCFAVLYRSAGCVYFPDIIKPYVWLDDEEIASTATTDATYTPFKEKNSFFKEGLVKNGITVKSGSKQYKFIHIRGIHEPFYSDENGDECDEHWDWKVTTKGCVKILGEYFDQLKEAGVYDNSVIIVTGDHGYHHTRGVLSNPAFLIKYKNEHGEIKTNSNEAGLGNFCATIADLCGAPDPSAYGLSIRDIDENTSFDRFFYTNTHTSDGIQNTGCLMEYKTAADTNDVRKFEVTGVEYTVDGEKIDHKKYCQTCIDHIEPVEEDEFHIIWEHCEAPNHP